MPDLECLERERSDASSASECFEECFDFDFSDRLDALDAFDIFDVFDFFESEPGESSDFTGDCKLRRRSPNVDAGPATLGPLDAGPATLGPALLLPPRALALWLLLKELGRDATCLMTSLQPLTTGIELGPDTFVMGYCCGRSPTWLPLAADVRLNGELGSARTWEASVPE